MNLIWNWFGLISPKTVTSRIYEVIHLTKWKILCLLRLAQKFDEIQWKNFPKVSKAYFPSVYRLNIPYEVCDRVAPSVSHLTTDTYWLQFDSCGGKAFFSFFKISFKKTTVFKVDFNAINRYLFVFLLLYIWTCS